MQFLKVTPVRWLEARWTKNRKEILSFFLVYLTGICIHLFVMTNKFFNYFEMSNILADMSYSQNDSLGLGRWFMPVVTNLFSRYSIPSLNGLVCIGYVSGAAALSASLLRMNHAVHRYLLGVLFVAFPGIASILSYGVNSDLFCFCLFFAVLSVYLLERCRFGFAAGALILALSIGAYQPYLSLAIAVSYGILFFEVLRDDFQVKDFLKKGIRLAAMMAVGFTLYYVILQLILKITGISLSSYRGVDNMTSFTLKGIIKGFVYSYAYFLKYLFSLEYTYTYARVIFNVLGMISFVLLLGFILRGKSKVQKFWSFFLVALLPLGLNASPFLMADRVGNGVDRYMLISIMLVWAILFVLMEQARANKPLVQWIGSIAACVAALASISITNEAYHRLDAMTTATNSLMTRIVSRIEAHPGWNAEVPVYFVNPENLFNENYPVDIPKYNALKNVPGTEIKPWYNELAYQKYMEVYLNFPVQLADQEEKNKAMNNLQFDKIKSFPAAESVTMVDGVLVIKISNDTEGTK